MHSDFAEPAYLARQLAANAHLYPGVNLHTLMPMAAPPYAQRPAADHLQVQTFFPGGGLRRAVNEGLVKPRRCSLSAIPGFFNRDEIKADMVLLQVSPPNDKGQVSLGVSVDYMPEVLAQNPIVVAQINSHMPFTAGDSLLDWEQIDYCVQVDEPLVSFPASSADPVDSAIAQHVAGLLRDGDIIQAGIGALPDAVLANLGHLKHLGIHTGILTAGWQLLIETGVVDNSTKKVFRGKSVTTMAGGDADFYAYLNNNLRIEFHPCSLTHHFETLSAIDNLCAINSVLQLDLSANANAETVNGRLIATPGGLPDFAGGASAAKGGKSIIALRSSFKSGQFSNIVAALPANMEPSLPAAMINYVVTEYGVAALDGLGANARAEALIAIAHPDHRARLIQQWAER